MFVWSPNDGNNGIAVNTEQVEAFQVVGSGSSWTLQAVLSGGNHVLKVFTAKEDAVAALTELLAETSGVLEI